MFGMLNTLVNISFRNEYAAICGFTKDEVICNFSEHLSELADNYALTKCALMDTMSTFYGGYHFSRGLIGVYNPFSDVNMDDPKLFLYQSGYLTIKKVVGSSYMLGYPNREVRNAMLGMSLPNR